MTRWRFQCDDGHSHCLHVMDAPEGRCGVEGCAARIKARPERLLVPRFGWHWVFAFAAVPAIVVFAVRQVVSESSRYKAARAELARIAQLEGIARPKQRIWTRFRFI